MIRGKRQADIATLLQQETMRQGMSANISLLHASSMAKHDDIRQPALHDKFTGLRIDGGIGLPFTVIFDHCAGTRLFPVQFVTEW
ncbi:MAG: hypothetical protein E5Y31_09250 [Mesorhizobium sp.]|nr:MAG: hypothetical protein E5Y31_09250 [Mesorhizobium sp.]